MSSQKVGLKTEIPEFTHRSPKAIQQISDHHRVLVRYTIMIISRVNCNTLRLQNGIHAQQINKGKRNAILLLAFFATRVLSDAGPRSVEWRVGVS